MSLKTKLNARWVRARLTNLIRLRPYTRQPNEPLDTIGRANPGGNRDEDLAGDGVINLSRGKKPHALVRDLIGASPRNGRGLPPSAHSLQELRQAAIVAPVVGDDQNHVDRRSVR